MRAPIGIVGRRFEDMVAHGCMRLETGLTIRILRYLSNIYEDIPN